MVLLSLSAATMTVQSEVTLRPMSAALYLRGTGLPESCFRYVTRSIALYSGWVYNVLAALLVRPC